MTNCFGNPHAKFEINRTIIPQINYLNELSVTDGQTLNIEKLHFFIMIEITLVLVLSMSI